MSEYLHPGLHPDADSLNAFIEGVLPEHERLECLAHLADCLRCREIVYLAQEPAAPASIPADPVPFWKRWFTKRWFVPIPALAAAVVCVLLVSIGVYRLIQPKRVEPVLTAAATPAIEPLAPLYQPPKPPAPRPAKPSVTRQAAPPAEHPAIIQNAAPAAVPVALAPPPPAPAAPPPLPAPSVVRQAFVEAQSAQLQNPAVGVATAGIAGTVTDPAGGVVAGARITVHPVTGTSSIDTRTDGKGQYNLAGLAPGPYELQILSPGFKQARKQIDLQPQLVAREDSTLELGAATETITVNAEASLLKTESGQVSATVLNGAPALPLLPANSRASLLNGVPARLPPPTTASRDKLMLKADSAGALSFSKNGGRSWKAVKPNWPGKVVRVESAHDPGAVFQLTTDSGSVWLSRDGTHWNPAPALH
jgi:hypothetical protein